MLQDKDHKLFANIVLEMIKRTTFQGVEIDSMIAVRSWATDIANGTYMVTPPAPKENGSDDGTVPKSA